MIVAVLGLTGTAVAPELLSSMVSSRQEAGEDQRGDRGDLEAYETQALGYQRHDSERCAGAVAEFVLQRAGLRARWADLPPSARVMGASTRDGRRLWFVSNWAWDPVTVPTPLAGRSLLSGRDMREGGSLQLGARDVDVVVEG